MSKIVDDNMIYQPVENNASQKNTYTFPISSYVYDGTYGIRT